MALIPVKYNNLAPSELILAMNDGGAGPVPTGPMTQFCWNVSEELKFAYAEAGTQEIAICADFDDVEWPATSMSPPGSTATAADASYVSPPRKCRPKERPASMRTISGVTNDVHLSTCRRPEIIGGVVVCLDVQSYGSRRSGCSSVIGTLASVGAVCTLGTHPVCTVAAFLRESVRRTRAGVSLWGVVSGVQNQSTDVASKKANLRPHRSHIFRALRSYW
jgi:hypothetical protein